MILILAKLLEMVSVNLFWRFVLLMLAEKEKGKIVISAILHQFIYFYYLWQIFLLAVLLAVLGISIYN